MDRFEGRVEVFEVLDHFLCERVFCAGRQIQLEKAETYFETSATITRVSDG